MPPGNPPGIVGTQAFGQAPRLWDGPSKRKNVSAQFSICGIGGFASVCFHTRAVAELPKTQIDQRKFQQSLRGMVGFCGFWKLPGQNQNATAVDLRNPYALEYHFQPLGRWQTLVLKF